MIDKNREIKIKLKEESYQRILTIANIMEISVEELTENAVISILYTFKQHLVGIEEHIFPQQIMFE